MARNNGVGSTDLFIWSSCVFFFFFFFFLQMLYMLNMLVITIACNNVLLAYYHHRFCLAALEKIRDSFQYLCEIKCRMKSLDISLYTPADLPVCNRGSNPIIWDCHWGTRDLHRFIRKSVPVLHRSWKVIAIVSLTYWLKCIMICAELCYWSAEAHTQLHFEVTEYGSSFAHPIKSICSSLAVPIVERLWVYQSLLLFESCAHCHVRCDYCRS